MNGTRRLETDAGATAGFAGAREGMTRARLEFPRGAARLSIGGAEIPELFRARFSRPGPAIAVEGRTITVAYPRISLRSWVGPWRSRRGRVALSTDAIWALSIRGVAHLDADLRDVEVEAIDIARGASDAAIRLPRPTGIVPVRMNGGVSEVAIRHPGGAAVRLRVRRGVVDLRFGEQKFGAVGGDLHLETPDAGLADDRYEIEISGGAAHLWITVDDPMKEG